MAKDQEDIKGLIQSVQMDEKGPEPVVAFSIREESANGIRSVELRLRSAPTTVDALDNDHYDLIRNALLKGSKIWIRYARKSGKGGTLIGVLKAVAEDESDLPKQDGSGIRSVNRMQIEIMPDKAPVMLANLLPTDKANIQYYLSCVGKPGGELGPAVAAQVQLLQDAEANGLEVRIKPSKVEEGLGAYLDAVRIVSP